VDDCEAADSGSGVSDCDMIVTCTRVNLDCALSSNGIILVT
jgi:hypothetical protein